jgi:predicted DNA-binding transcriptional regulator YafY
MTRDKDKLVRQLSLLSFLLSRQRPFTAREIQESVEGYWAMSDDTFARRFHGDRADLAKIGLEIRSAAQGESTDTPVYFLPQDDYRQPAVELSADERRALAVALRVLEGRFPYCRPLRLAFAAISQGLPEPIRDDLDDIPIALAADSDAFQSGRQLARLEDAVGRRKTVLFAYSPTDGPQEERRVDPYSLFFIKGHWYVVGLDHAREGIRTFRITRIRGAVRFATEKAQDFEVPEDYDPKSYGARPPWLLGETKGVATIRVDEDLAWWVSKLGPHVEPLEEDDEGRTLFAVPFADERALLAWVAGAGDCAELVSPAGSRHRLAACLTTVLSEHQGKVPTPAPPTGGVSLTDTPRIPTPALKPGPIPAEHLARAISLMQYLLDERHPCPIPWETIQKDLSLTRKEIENDLDLLNLVNFGGGTYSVMAEARANGVHVTPEAMADTFARPARLSPLMTRALILALDLLGEAIADGSDTLASVRDKVLALAAAPSDTPDVLVEDVARVAPGLLKTLNRCVDECRLVDIEYFTPTKGRVTTRRVEPYLVFRADDSWYLEAFCLKAGGQRTFRLEFLRSATPTDRFFERRPEVDLTARTSETPLRPTGTVEWATVHFKPRWRHFLDDRGTPYDVLSDGSLRGRIAYLDESWIARETIRFLGDAVVEHPETVRSLITTLTGGLLGRYQEARDGVPGGPA